MTNNRFFQLSEKYKQFFADKSKGQILCTICPYTFELDYKKLGFTRDRLDAWDFSGDAREFVKYQVDKNRAFMDYTRDLDNDYFPALNVNLGYGAHSAYFTGAEVIMGADTSWAHPILTDWSDLDQLKMDENNYWYRKILEMYGYMKEFCEGDYVLSAFSNAGPGDMANAIRGNDLFYDLMDEPENVHQLMDKCADAVIWLETKIREIAGYIHGGTVTANVWFPNQTPYISEDFSDLCSDEMYREFGYRYTQKILNHFGGAFIHHHAKGYQVHKSIATLNSLNLLEISLDPKCDRPIDRIEEVFEMNNGVPLMIRCHARDLKTHIDRLKQGRVVIMLNIDSLEEGKEAMKLIRKNSII